MPELLVIGIGNRDRGDDAVGPRVARALAARRQAGLEVLEHSGEGTSLMEAWRGRDRVVLVDCVVSGEPAGTIVRLDAGEAPLPARSLQSSTHAFGPGEAVEIARALKRLPATLIVYGIEGESFEVGAELTDAVETAVSEAVELILMENADARDVAAEQPHEPDPRGRRA